MGVLSEIQKDLNLEVVALFGECHDALLSEARALCNDDSGAEDLVMRTFEAYCKSRDNFDPGKGSWLSWLRGIMRNLHHNSSRGKAVGCMVYMTPEELAQIQDREVGSGEADDAVLRNSDAEVVRNAIGGLSPDMREVIVLRYFEDLPISRIAQILGASENSVKCRLYYARKILAKRLGGKLGKKSLALLLAALLGVGTLFGAWFSPLGDWVAEKVFGSAPAEVAVVVQADVEPAVEERVASTPAPQADANVISETQKQESEDNMNISARIKKTAATAAVSAVGLAAVVPTASAAGGFTSQSYAGIAEGAMYAQWDAIDNAGIGQHEASVTKWVNLVDANYNLTYYPDSRLSSATAAFSETGWTSRSDYKCYFQGCDQNWWKGTGTNFTFEAFVRPYGDDYSRWSMVKGGIMGNYEQSGTRGLYFGRFIDTSFRFGFEKLGNASIAREEINEWDSHPLLLTMVCDSYVGMRMYINGELYAQTAAPSTPGLTLNCSGPFYISRSYPTDSGGFAGVIHSVRVYKKCLSAVEVEKNYQIDMARFYEATPVKLTSKKRSARAYVQDKLLSQWDAIENVGVGVHQDKTARWADLGSYGVGLRYVKANGTTAFGERGLPMIGGSAGQYFKGYGIDWWSKQAGAFTWEAYVVPDASWSGTPNAGQPRAIMGLYWQSSQYSVTFGDNGGKSSSYGVWYGAGETDGKGSTVSVPNDAIPNDKPILLTYVADGENGCKLYTNGVFCASNAAACHALNCTKAFCLGQNYPDGARGFGGTIHAVRIYTKALSQEEIKQNYDIDRLRFYDKGKGLVLLFM